MLSWRLHRARLLGGTALVWAIGSFVVALLVAAVAPLAFGLHTYAVQSGSIWHIGQPELDEAIASATKRPLGDAWAWSRKNATTDISPLVAVTLATFGLANRPAYDPLESIW